MTLLLVGIALIILMVFITRQLTNSLLSDFDAEQLFYTIPDFHNTRKRYEKLKADMKSDPCGRVSEVRDACPGVIIREDMLLDMLADMIFPAVTGFGVHPSFSAFWPTNATPACM